MSPRDKSFSAHLGAWFLVIVAATSTAIWLDEEAVAGTVALIAGLPSGALLYWHWKHTNK